ncbi:MAG: serine/threonine-protein kinase [Planctomycetota bacterium]|jgi:serine/threonine protein kinase|nr:serine/threonine-protein kinase [Planctomycetota bacterium]MDA1202190.1 serine/threonine-protein kinase [Planctomycetota bacterium]
MSKIPERLGPLKLVQQIGVGRNCQIWEAADKRGQAWAVKMVVPLKASDPAERAYLEHELKVAKSLDHPTIIKIDRFSEEGGLPHLVIELFPHPNLKKQVQAGVDQLVPRLQRLVTELALALDHVHGRGWVHRDVKPENVLATPEGQVKLIDFAIASRASGLLGKLLGGKTPAQGSPSYMSPEQIRGQALDARSDIYSYGCVLFELLAGRPPYTATDTNELLNKHVSAPVPPVDKFAPLATSGAARFLRRLLAKKPGDRPKSMQEVLAELRSTRLVERAAVGG